MYNIVAISIFIIEAKLLHLDPIMNKDTEMLKNVRLGCSEEELMNIAKKFTKPS